MTTIKNGGIFGRGGDGSFDDLTVTGSVTVPVDSISGNAIDSGTAGVDKLIADDVITAGGTTVTHGASSNGTIRVEGTSAPAFAINDTGQSREYFLTALGDFVQMRYADAGDTGGFANSTSLLTMEATGDVTVNTGNLVIGTSGKGIDFSATSGTGTSELFDDYEEGTWTPTLVGASSAGTYSIAASGCTYTKVGRLVTVMGKMTITVSSAGSGSAQFGGLPFTTSGDAVAIGTAISKNVDLDNSTVSLALQPWTSDTNLFAIVSVRDNSTTATLDVSGISTGDFIIINTTYIT